MSRCAVEITGVHKNLDGAPVLRDLQWRVPEGSVVGLLGRNGAGKTTLLNCLLGISPFDDGRIEVFGQSANALDDEVKGRIGFVPQSSDDLAWMTIEEALDYTGLFYANWRHDFVKNLMSQWHLVPDRPLQKLSKGERQKVDILRALGHNPDLLLLDEPVAALDPIARQAFISELVDIALEDAKTIIFSTHITSDLERIAADVVFLHEGRIALSGPVDELKERIVRLRLADRDLEKLDLPGVIQMHSNGGQSVVTLNDYPPSLVRQLRQDGIAVDVEHLNLEQIFVELCA
ncbi:MAG: ABC transporter ATP-binding protein [Gammaproteobacteria bacterium]